MKCGHCQNWQISRPSSEDGEEMLRTPAAREGRAAALATSGCEGVAFTYNEPVIWVEYVRDVSRLAHEAGLYTVMVTNGFITTEGLDALAGLIDVWRVDVKGITDEQYRTLCRVPSVAPGARGRRAREAACTGCTWRSSPTSCRRSTTTRRRSRASPAGSPRGSARTRPWHITRFFPYLEFADLPPTPHPDAAARPRARARRRGCTSSTWATCREPGGEDTECPACGAIAVGAGPVPDHATGDEGRQVRRLRAGPRHRGVT